MDITHYAFAAYVFLLVCGGIWFFAKVFRVNGKGKGDKSSYEKEQRLFTLYQNVEDTLSSFEEFAEETKKETQATLQKAEELLEEAKRLSAQMNDAKTITPQPVPQRTPARGVRWSEPYEDDAETPPEMVMEEPKHEAPPRSSYRPAAPARDEEERPADPPLKTNEKILLLSAQGLSVTEIAKTLGISVREVTLAQDLARK